MIEIDIAAPRRGAHLRWAGRGRAAFRRVRSALRRHRRTVAVTAFPVVLATTIVGWAAAGDPAGPTDVGLMWVCFNLAVLTSAVMMLVRWSLLNDIGAAWGAAALLCTGVYLQPMFAVTPATWSPSLSLVDAAAILIVLTLLRRGAPRRAPTGWSQPIAVGLAAGLALVAVRDIWSVLGPSMPTWVTYVVVVGTFPVAVALCITAALDLWRRASHRRDWIFALVLVVTIFMYHVVPRAPLPHPSVDILVAAAVVVGASLLVVIASESLRDAVRRHARRLVQLTDRAAEAEHAVHHDEEMRHEFRATVAGIDAATRLLLHSSSRMEPEQAASMQHMLDAELIRLQHLVRAPVGVASGGVGLDADQESETVEIHRLLEPLVLSQRAQGGRVELPPTDATVHGAADELAKAFHVLLCNARVHAAGATVRITLAQTPGTVTVKVHDDGPGIPDDLRPTLFGRRAKGASSDGEGLGLYSARQALRRQGGDLRLEDTSTGTAFAVVLPRGAQ